MGRPKYRWWSFALNMVKAYPALCTMKKPSCDDLRERDAVQAAINATMQMDQGEQRIELIRSVYWGKRKQNIDDVYAQLDIDPTVADRWHGDFIRQVGKHWGFDIT